MNLHGRQLLWWIGARLSDAQLFNNLSLYEVEGSITVTGRSASGGRAISFVFEEQSSIRPAHNSNAAEIFLSRLTQPALARLETLAGPRIFVPYRPYPFVEKFCRSANDKIAGVSSSLYAHLNNRVEIHNTLVREGIFQYETAVLTLTECDYNEARARFGSHFFVKATDSCGGSGCYSISSKTDWQRVVQVVRNANAVLCSCIDGPTYNCHGVVNRNGDVHCFQPSLQLVGIPELTSNKWGYCGNVFRMADRLAAPSLTQEITRIGIWLYGQGFRGAFGCDFVLSADKFHLIDLNARWQGSSLLLNEILRIQGEEDIASKHLSSFIGRPGIIYRRSIKDSVPGARNSECSVVQILCTNISKHRLRVLNDVGGCFYGLKRNGQSDPVQGSMLEHVITEEMILFMDCPGKGAVIETKALICRVWIKVTNPPGLATKEWKTIISSVVDKVWDTLGLEISQSE